MWAGKEFKDKREEPSKGEGSVRLGNSLLKQTQSVTTHTNTDLFYFSVSNFKLILSITVEAELHHSVKGCCGGREDVTAFFKHQEGSCLARPEQEAGSEGKPRATLCFGLGCVLEFWGWKLKLSTLSLSYPLAQAKQIL